MNSREPSHHFLSNALYTARDLEGKKPLFVKTSLFLIKDVPKMRKICQECDPTIYWRPFHTPGALPAFVPTSAIRTQQSA
jgi:hypothetical protein